MGQGRGLSHFLKHSVYLGEGSCYCNESIKQGKNQGREHGSQASYKKRKKYLDDT